MILAGDIGGTKCNIALVEAVAGGAGGAASGTGGGIVDGNARAPAVSGAASFPSGVAPGAARSPLETDPGSHANGYRISFLRRYPSLKYAQFADVLAEFLRDAAGILGTSPAGKVTAAGFGVAGPVIGRSVRVTNVDWSIEAAALEKQLDTHHVALMNDLEATAYSLPWLGSSDMISLNAGVPAAQAPQALIAAGTGLGESTLHWCGGRYVVTPTEGGHTDFAPRSELEIGLWRHIKQTSKFVSCELIISGRGFQTIHQFLNAAEHANSHQPGVDPAEITRRGLEGSCRICVQTLDLWTSIYGAEAGNLALKALARGGMFVAGGIAPKILAKMKDGTFLRAFCEKEKFEELLSKVPVQLVLNEDAPLLGAAAEADRALRAGTTPQPKT